MRRATVALGAVLAVLLAVPALAFAGQYTLHPSGFGEHSYSSWKGGEGLPDSRGSKNQSLYFQKNTSTPTFAAGVAVFKGFEGMPTSAVLPLEFWWGMDGHCGAGAPRFNVRYAPAGGGPNQTVFVGCAAMVPGGVATAPNGRVFQQKTFAGPLPPGEIVSLAIVFDEGREFGRCDGAPGVLSGESCVYLDNIRVAQHVWTSASDNSNNQTITSAPLGEAFVAQLLGESLAAALSPPNG
jgi:hypothetical protein